MATARTVQFMYICCTQQTCWFSIRAPAASFSSGVGSGWPCVVQQNTPFRRGIWSFFWATISPDIPIKVFIFNTHRNRILIGKDKVETRYWVPTGAKGPAGIGGYIYPPYGVCAILLRLYTSTERLKSVYTSPGPLLEIDYFT
jgi:hypothetical protein